MALDGTAGYGRGVMGRNLGGGGIEGEWTAVEFFTEKHMGRVAHYKHWVCYIRKRSGGAAWKEMC